MYFDPKVTGERIKKAREEIGFTQEMLSKSLNTSRSHISKIEAGVKAPSIDLLIEISKFFNVSLDYLIIGKTIPRDNIQTDIKHVISILEHINNTI